MAKNAHRRKSLRKSVDRTLRAPDSLGKRSSMSKFLTWRVGLSTRFMDLVVRTPLFKKVVRWLFPNTVLRYLKTMIYRQQLKDIQKKLEKSFQGPPNRSAPFSDALKNPVKEISVRLEGPFSGSDNISVCNRAMVMAMKKMGLDVSTINSDEEGLPVPLSTQTLADHPFLGDTILRYEALSAPDLDLRQQYPPVSGNMVGKINAFHSCAWEESVFPRKFVEEFNTNLDFIGVTSRFVEKTLRDNGVSIPIVVQGLGPTPLPPGEIDKDMSDHLKSFVFLHISSCVLDEKLAFCFVHGKSLLHKVRQVRSIRFNPKRAFRSNMRKGIGIAVIA